MNNSTRYHIFWSNTSPLTCLSGAALLIMASDRLSHAIVALSALVWVYCLSALVARAVVRLFPQRGRLVLLSFFCSFVAGLYLLFLWIVSPLCAMESFFIAALIPLYCMVSGVFKRLETLSSEDAVSVSFSEAVILGVLIVIFAVIREPIGYLSLSLPGGVQGSVLLFSFETESFLPIYLVSGSSGALLLFGYFLGLYRYVKSKRAPQEDQG